MDARHGHSAEADGVALGGFAEALACVLRGDVAAGDGLIALGDDILNLYVDILQGRLEVPVEDLELGHAIDLLAALAEEAVALVSG